MKPISFLLHIKPIDSPLSLYRIYVVFHNSHVNDFFFAGEVDDVGLGTVRRWLCTSYFIKDYEKNNNHTFLLYK